jgi:hypothetical protein
MASALLCSAPEDHVQQRIPHDGRGARPVLLGTCLVAALGAAACNETVGGNKPVGKAVDSDAQIERFLRRAYLDLSGHVPGDGELTGATARLRDAGNTATARGELVDELIAQDGFATAWFDEFENSVFGGNSLEQQYNLICGLTRALAQPCKACTEVDSCACACDPMRPLATERAQLRTSAADLRSGTESSTIERRYAMATGYFAIAGSPENRVTALFDDFLSRTAEPDEIENGRAMIIGALFPPAPAGLLFHRLGGTYADLIDIVFDSEVYREAMVRRVFDRYLARSPSSPELAHFVSTLDAYEPDARGVVRAVVSSREYFDQ